jgi:general secretion pathway protein G
MEHLGLRTVACSAAIALGVCAAAQEPAPSVSVSDRLAKDPIFAWTTERQNLDATWDEVTTAIRRFLPEEQQAEFDAGLRTIDEKLGLSLRDDLLALVGPEMGGTFDLPPIDTIVGLFMANSSEGLQMATSRLGIVTRVRQREQLNRSLHHLLDLAGATLKQEAELMGVTFHPDPTEPELTLRAYYGFKGDFLAVGFSPDWVRAALAGQRAGGRLGDGADYQLVRKALDTDPELVAYLNLPRLQRVLGSSQMVRGGLAAEPEAATFAEILFDESLAKIGAGVSTRRLEEGVRRTTFGPRWMGGAMQMAMIAAIAIPNYQNALGVGRQRRTMADMRTLATAMEAHRIDHGEVPSSDGGWQDVSIIEENLSPTYLNTMPTKDAWGHSFQVKSDGRDYWIVSPGEDGELSTDWSTVTEIQVIVGNDHDLAYTNGEFLTKPAEEVTP